MAAAIFNAVGKVGLGLAVVGATASQALFNGMSCHHMMQQQNHPENGLLFLLPVDGGHRAVIFDRFVGIKPNVIGEGTHFLIPWVQRPIIFDIRSRPRNVPSVTGSKGMPHAGRHFMLLTGIFSLTTHPIS